jgi:Flp pilus assembly protein CpaB
MRSFILFISCFFFIAAAIYFAFQSIWSTAAFGSSGEAIAEASPLPEFDVALLQKSGKKGHVITATDLEWIVYTGETDPRGLLTRQVFQSANTDRFVLLDPTQMGNVINLDRILFEKDPGFVQAMLSDGTALQEITVTNNARFFQILSPGDPVDLYLLIGSQPNNKLDIETSKDRRVIQLLEGARLLELPKQGSDNEILLEIPKEMVRILLLAQRIGELSLSVSNGSSKQAYKLDINQFYGSIRPGRLERPSKKPAQAQKIVIQRGENSSTILPVAEERPND